MTVSAETKGGDVHLYKSVIDRSMTIFSVMGMDYHRKLSLTDQWQLWYSFLRMSLTGQLQFLLPLGMGYHRKLSLTGQWQFFGSPGPIGSCLKQRIIPLYGHTTYGHMSLTTVNDKSLWTKLKKVSLTLVNDKKIVIDHGQWQKKLSLTERYLYRDRGYLCKFDSCATCAV